MGNCTASKLGGGGGEEEPVALCRERKRLIKAAVDRRRALADAHQRYFHSIHAVAGAINLFVARHSSPSPVLITLPSPSPSPSPPSSSSDPSFLRQTPAQPKTEILAYCSSASSSTSSAPTSNLRDERDGEGLLFSEMPTALAWETEVYGWDFFFNPFEGFTPVVSTGVLGRSSEEELKAVREREGIPELEEEAVQEAKKEVVPMEVKETVKKVENGERQEDGGKDKELMTMEVTEKKMELLDGLKDVEVEFIKAYDSGKELARMLETDIVGTQPWDDEFKENSSKFIQAITWHRSFSSMSSSSRSSWASDWKNALLTEKRSELFEDYGGMGSGSHSQTLGRLYAWEKKLYEEVKTGERTRQTYQKKCLHLQNHDAKAAGSDKSRAAVKGLYARIWVALRTIETISNKIQKVRDEELHPQLIELLHGMMQTWRSMLQSHDRQKQLMIDIKAFTCPSYGRYCSDSQRQVTKKLEEQLENWRCCFKNYVSAQRSYVEALNEWFSKFFVSDTKYRYRARYSAPSYREASPLLSILREWSSSSRKLPDRAVSISMKGFISNMRDLAVKQEEGQQQKRKVDYLTKEFDQKLSTLQISENRILEFKLSDALPEQEARDRVEYLAGRKHFVEMHRQKLEVEKTKHQNCMQETTEATLNGFKSGFCRVFGSLTDFLRESLELYDELLALNERSKVEIDAVAENKSYIQGLKAEVDVR